LAILSLPMSILSLPAGLLTRVYVSFLSVGFL
jgi:hypothetical protein